MTKAHTRRTGQAALALSVLILLAAALVSVRQWRAFAGRALETERAGEILRLNRTLLNDVLEAESAERGFLLTGQPDYLVPHDSAAARIPSTLERLVRAASAEPAAAQRVNALGSLVRGKLDEMRRTIQVRRTKGLAAALDIMRTDQGNVLMEGIRSICVAVEAGQSEARERSWTGLLDSALAARWIVFAAGVIAAALAAAGARALSRAARG